MVLWLLVVGYWLLAVGREKGSPANSQRPKANGLSHQVQPPADGVRVDVLCGAVGAVEAERQGRGGREVTVDHLLLGRREVAGRCRASLLCGFGRAGLLHFGTLLNLLDRRCRPVRVHTPIAEIVRRNVV